MNIDITKFNDIELIILKGKFADTIAALENAYATVRATYGIPDNVYTEVSSAKTAFYSDLQNLAGEIAKQKRDDLLYRP